MKVPSDRDIELIKPHLDVPFQAVLQVPLLAPQVLSEHEIEELHDI